jgi:hypothetical protein
MLVTNVIDVILSNHFFIVSKSSSGSQVPQSKYAELLSIIEELGKEIRPTYAGSKSAMERLKRGMCLPIHAL